MLRHHWPTRQVQYGGPYVSFPSCLPLPLRSLRSLAFQASQRDVGKEGDIKDGLVDFRPVSQNAEARFPPADSAFQALQSCPSLSSVNLAGRLIYDRNN